jgi:thiol-disulfide isomerase/thioredoxin
MPALWQAFEEASLSSFEGETDVVALDFGATWCSPCERQRPIFERVARWFVDERPDARIAFVTVDVDENQDLCDRFDVKSVPTTIVTRHEEALLWGKRWREKRRFQGIVPFETLRAAVQGVVDGDG